MPLKPMIRRTLNEDTVTHTTCRNWYKASREGNFKLEDREAASLKNSQITKRIQIETQLKEEFIVRLWYFYKHALNLEQKKQEINIEQCAWSHRDQAAWNFNEAPSRKRSERLLRNMDEANVEYRLLFTAVAITWRYDTTRRASPSRQDAFYNGVGHRVHLPVDTSQ